MNNNSIVPIPSSNALNVTVHFEDVTPPTVVSFDFDLDSGKLLLTFSETVRASSVKPSKFLFQRTVRVTGAEWHQLTGGNVSTNDSTGIVITLTNDDLNVIKALLSLAVSKESTYISLTAGALQDMNAVNIEEISNLTAIAARSYVADTTAPEVEAFDLDLNSNTLTLQFSETVKAASLRPRFVSLQSQTLKVGSEIYNLTSSSAAKDSATLVISLSQADSDSIKISDVLAESANSTHLVLDSLAITDMNDNFAKSVPTGLKVRSYQEDTTPPQLLEFKELDLDKGSLLLSFNEAISATSYNEIQTTLRNGAPGTTSRLLSGGRVSGDSGSEIRLLLDILDLNAIKALPDLGVSPATSFLSLNRSSFADMNGNQVVAVLSSSALQAKNYSADVTAPELSTFDFSTVNNLPPLQLTLHFSETVNISSFVVTKITLQLKSNTSESNVSYTLTGGSYETVHTADVVVNITDADFSAFQSRYPLASDTNSTHISLTASTARDMVGIAVVQIASTAAKRIDKHTADLTRPSLLSFSLNMDNGQVLLSFDENINPLSYKPTKFTIQSSKVLASPFYTLSGGTSSKHAENVISIILTNDDLNELKKKIGLADTQNTTYISAGVSAVQDLSNNDLHAVSSAAAIRSSEFFADVSSPELLNFDLQLNAETLSLFFSETVNVSSFDSTGITLLAARSRVATAYQLTSGVVTTPDGPILKLNLSETDRNAIKALTDLAIDADSTFISIGNIAVRDMSGNRVVEIDKEDAKAVRSYNNDTTAPRLLFFDLDMNDGSLTLSFDETVDVSELLISDLVIRTSADLNTSISFTLNTSTVPTMDTASVVVRFSREDLNEIKRLQICTSLFDCYLSYSSSLVVDMVQLSLIAGENGTTRAVRDYTLDKTKPKLDIFTEFDLQRGVMKLEFSETVNTSSLNASALYLQTLFEDPISRVALSSVATTANSHAITLTLSDSDVVKVKKDKHLCSRRGTCYFSMSGLAIRDMAGNLNSRIVDGSPGKIVQRFISDEQSPVLEYFKLDMNTGVLTLGFDEVVDSDTLLTSGITIQGQNFTSDPELRYTFEEKGASPSKPGKEITVPLSATDLRKLKASSFAKDENSTYISIAEGTVKDMGFDANPSKQISGLTILRDNYVADSTAPNLPSFTLDLSKNELSLSFDEPVDQTSLNFSKIDLHTASKSFALTLTGGVTRTATDSTELIISLSDADITNIKLSSDFVARANDTFLSLRAGAANDLAGVPLSAVDSKEASSVVTDTTRLSLEEFSIDMFSGQLNLTFNDVALVSSLDPTGLTLQDAAKASVSYTLTSSTTVESKQSGHQLTVLLSGSDLYNIKSRAGLAESKESTYLTMQAVTADDWESKDVLAITDENGLQVKTFIADVTDPVLLSFSINMTSGEVILSFSKAVDADSTVLSQITLQNKKNLSEAESVFTLTGGVPLQRAANLQVAIQLSSDDLNKLKADPNIATEKSDTFLSLPSGTVKDPVGNNVTGVNGQSALDAGDFVVDSASPTLNSFSLDLSKDTLTLTFSETILLSSFNASEITIQDRANISLSAASVTLTGGEAKLRNYTIIELVLDEKSIDYLKTTAGIGSRTSNTYISLKSGTILDVSGNQVNSIASQVAKRVESVDEDNVNPSLDSFTFDLGSNQLILTFTEAVKISTLNVSDITVVNSSTAPQKTHVLRKGTYDKKDSRKIAITLDRNDVDAVKVATDLATSVNSTFLSFTGHLATDIAGLAVLPRRLSDPIQAKEVVADATAPLLESFVLDLNSNILKLTFTEPVDVLTFKQEKVTLTNANETVSYSLTQSSVISGDSSSVVSVVLGAADRDAIRTNPQLAASNKTTYVSLGSGAFFDTNNNSLVEMLSPIQVSDIVADSSKPSLLSYSVDLNTNEISLTFSETVNISSLNVTGITLYSQENVTGADSYTLNVGSQPSGNSTSIVKIPLSQVDRDALRSNAAIFSNSENTYLTVAADSALDMARNSLTGADSPIKVELLVNDTKNPTLIGSDFDLDSGILDLTFSETIDIASFDPSEVFVQDKAKGFTDRVSLAGSTFAIKDLSVIRLNVAKDQLDAIKVARSLATSSASTIVTVSNNTALDTAGLPTSERDAVQVTKFVADTTRPSFVSFSVNMHGANLTLTFSEAVDASSFNISQIFLQNNVTATEEVFTFTGFSSISDDGAELTIAFTSNDINKLNTLPYCTSAEDCYISFTTGLVKDMVSLPLNALVNVTAVKASRFVVDKQAPSLLSFEEINFNDGTFTLVFSEAVRVSTLNVSVVELKQWYDTGFPRSEVALTTGSTTSSDGTSVVVTLSSVDLNSIKSAISLCISPGQCYIRFSTEFIEDMAGNRVEGLADDISNRDLTSPTRVIKDTTGPKILAVDLNMETGELTVSLSEFASALNFDPTAITLQDKFNSTVSYTLTTRSAGVVSSGNPVFVIQLNSADLNEIRSTKGLAVDRNSTYVTASSDLARDTALDPPGGNKGVPLEDGISALQVQSYVRDGTAPVALDFVTLDLGLGTAEIKFSEPVDINSIDFSGISIQASSSGGEALNLTGGTASLKAGDPTVLVVQINNADLQKIKLNSALAARQENTYLVTRNGSLKDIAGNAAPAFGPDQVTTYRADNLAPALSGFTLDMQNGLLTLTFDDVVLPDQLQIENFITLQGNAAGTADSFKLTGGTTDSSIGFEITIKLAENDLKEINRLPGVATNINNTFVTMRASTITDVSSLGSVAILNPNGLQATEFLPDITPPYIMWFQLNITENLLVFRASEILSLASFTPGGFTLLSRKNASAGPFESYSLSDFTVSETRTEVYSLSLSALDIYRISQRPILASSLETTFLFVSSEALTDAGGNAVVPISSNDAMQATSLNSDVSVPTLLSFTLDVDQGELQLTFSETVNVTGLTPSHLTLQNAKTVLIPSGKFVSTKGEILFDGKDEGFVGSGVIRLKYSPTELDNLKLDSSIGITINDTYLSYDAAVVRDMNGLPLAGAPNGNARQAAAIIPDTTGAKIASYDLNLNTGIIVLNFDELVQASTFVVYNLTLVSSRSEPRTTFTLTTDSYTTTKVDNRTFTVIIGPTDLDRLKSLRFVAKTKATTLLSVGTATVKDVLNNSAFYVPREDAIEVSAYTGDSVAPLLYSFDLDMDDGLLSLNFSEPIDVTTMNFSYLSVQDASTRNQKFELSSKSQITAKNNAYEVEVRMSSKDLNLLKGLDKVALDSASSFISISSYFIKDTSGNNITAIADGSAQQVLSFTPDIVRPSLLSYDLLLTDGVQPIRFVLHFSEAINASSIKVTEITLQDKPDGNATLKFNNWTSAVPKANVADIEIVINENDLRALRKLVPLVNSNDSTFLSILSTAVKDMADLELLPVSGLAASKHEVEIVQPRLLQFDFNLNTSILTMTFSEKVRLDSFDPTKLKIQSTPDGSGSSYTFKDKGSLTRINSTVVQLKVGIPDADGLQQEFGLAVTKATTYMSLKEGLFGDDYLNLLEAINTGTAKNVDDFVALTGLPYIVFAKLDLNGIKPLELQFHFTINVSSFDFTQIKLLNASSPPQKAFAFTAVTINQADSALVKLILTKDDKTRLKKTPGIGESVTNTYISLTAATALDISGRSVVEISESNAHQLDEVVPDTAPPNIETFDLDINSGKLTLFFDETVDGTTFRTTGLTFLDQKTSAQAEYTMVSSSFIADTDVVRIDVSLSDEDLNGIKGALLCSSVADCYLTWTNGTIKDIFGLTATGPNDGNAVQASQVVPDVVAPKLNAFAEFNLADGTMTLNFSEAMNASSFVPSKITLQALFENPPSSLTLSGGDLINGNRKDIVVRLSLTDSATIKTDGQLCTGRGTCYVTIEDSAMKDMSGFAVAAVSRGLLTFTFKEDTSPPVLQSFNLDMNTGILTVKFNEPVDAATFTPSLITILSDVASSRNYTLTTSTSSSVDGNSITVTLSAEDLEGIKSQSFVKGKANTYVSIGEGMVSDLARLPNEIEAIPSSEAERVTDYAPDATAPRLLASKLDLQTDTLVLDFDEPIKLTSVDFTKLKISSGNVSFQLTGGVLKETAVYGSKTISVLLSKNDLIEIKKNTSLAVNINTKLALAEGFGSDSADIALAEVNETLLTEFVADTKRPSLVSYSADMHLGRLIFTFNDVVIPGTFKPEAVTVQSAPSLVPGQAVTLTDASTATGDAGYTVVVELGDDLRNIKLTKNLATRKDNMYLTIRADGIDDPLGLDITAITDGKAQQVADYSVDLVAPELADFDFDLDTGKLTLTFTDSVDVSFVDFTDITIQDSPVNPVQKYSLNDGDVQLLSKGLVAVLQLSNVDLNGLKALKGLADSANATYLYLGSKSFRDIAGNNVTVVSPAKKVVMFVNDTTRPTLDSVILDMDSGELTLGFSETIDVSKLSTGGFIVQSVRNAPEGCVTAEICLVRIVATCGEIKVGCITISMNLESSPPRDTVVITLSEADVDFLRKSSEIATNVNDTFVSYNETAAYDMERNAVVPAKAAKAKQVTQFIPDTTPPSATDTQFDLNSGLLTMTFTEGIDVATMNFSQLSVQSEKSTTNKSVVSYTFTDAKPSTDDNRIVRISLSKEDLNRLKTLGGLAESNDTTFFTFTSGFVKDLSGNDVAAISPENSLGVSSFAADTVKPSLDRVTLDMNKGLLLLDFDESVVLETLTADKILIQDSDFPIELLRLTDSSILPSDGAIVTVKLGESDFTTLKLNTALATSVDNTYVSFSGKIADKANNSFDVLFRAVKVLSYIDDTTGPQLISIKLNLNDGKVTMEFDEPIDISSFDSSGISFQSAENQSDGSVYSLTSTGRPTRGNGKIVEAFLDVVDLNAIKARPALTGTTPYVSLLSSTIKDMSGAGAAPIPATKALRLFELTADTTRPELDSFQVDLETGTVTLTFGETVDPSKLDPSQFVLQSSGDGTGQSVALSDSSVSTNYSSVVVLTLKGSVLDEIKLATRLGNTVNDTFISVAEDAAEDMFTLGLTEIRDTASLQASGLTTDTLPPKLIAFRFSLGDQNLTLHFNEAVDASSGDPSVITLRSNTSLDAVSIQLTSSTIIDQDGTDLVVSLSAADLNKIKANPGLCTGKTNCFVSFTSGLVDDMNGNAAKLLTEALQASPFTADFGSPQMEYFQELDLNSGRLAVVFTEIMDSTSFNLSAVRLQNYQEEISGLSKPPVYLSGGSLVAQNGLAFTFQLLNEDLNRIKETDGLCTVEVTCWIRFGSRFMKDVSGNYIEALENQAFNNKQHAGTVIKDTTGAQVSSFDFDLNSGELTLSFSEVVKTDTLDLDFLTVQSVGDVLQTYRLSTLTPQSPSSGLSSTVSLTLTKRDLNAIKSLYKLAKSSNTTNLIHSSSLVNDYVDNEAKNLTEAVGVATYSPDVVQPALLRFSLLDLSVGFARLHFSEPMDLFAFDFSKIFLQSAKSGGNLFKLSQGHAGRLASDNKVIDLEFVPGDTENLRNSKNVATSINDTFLFMVNGSAKDMAGNDIVGFSSTNAIQAEAFINRSLPVSVRSFDLDMDDGRLTIVFSGYVKAATVLPGKISLQSKDNGGNKFNLRSSTSYAPTVGEPFVVKFDLSEDDLQTIRSRSTLVKSRQTTFLVFGDNGVDSVAAIGFSGISASDALQVRTFTEDTTAPVLDSFSLDIDSGVLTLDTSEYVDVSSLVVNKLTIQNRADSLGKSVTLSGGSVSRNGLSQIVVNITTEDLYELKGAVNLGTDAFDTYLTVGEGAFKDVVGNRVPATTGTRARDLVPDTTAPLISSVELDLGKEEILMTFSEPIEVAKLNIPGVTLMNLAASPSETITLSGGVLTSTPTKINSAFASTLTIKLTSEDAELLKLNDKLGTNTSNTYFKLKEGLVADAVGLKMAQVQSIQAQTVVFDAVGPKLLSYDLDLDSGNLTLSFNEIVALSTLDPLKIVFYNSSQDPAESFSLTSTVNPSTSNASKVVITLTEDDLNALKASGNIALSPFVALQKSTVRDLFDNEALDQTVSDALVPTVFLPDSTPPSLSDFSLDMDSGSLSMTFSETVDLDSVDLTKLLIQDKAVNPKDTVTIGTGDLSVSRKILNVSLTPEVVTSIKLKENLASKLPTTYLSLLPGAITDTNGNAFAKQNASQASSFTADSTPPQLQKYDIVLKDGSLPVSFILTFNEPLSATFNVSRITLQSSASLPLREFSLSKSSVEIDGATATVTLSDADITDIRSLPPLLEDPASTFITLGAGVVSDVAGNALEAVTRGQAPSSQESFELTKPQLISFSINLNTNIFSVNFDEKVKASTFDPTQVTIQSTKDGVGAKSYTFTGGSAKRINDTTVWFIVDYDLAQLQTKTGLADSKGTTFLSLGSKAIGDVFLNFAKEIPSTAALQATSFVQNSRSPSIVEFSLDLNTGKPLTLVYSEAMNISLFDPKKVILLNSQTNAGIKYQLTGGTVPSVDGNTIEIYITAEDRDFLRKTSGFAETVANTFVAMPDIILTDLEKNVLTSIRENNAFQATKIVPDAEPPQIESFDFDVNSGKLVISFDETVLTSSIDMSNFLVQDNATNPTKNYSFSNTLVPDQGGVSSLTIQLAKDDLNGAKGAGVCLSAATCFFNGILGAITDVTGNSIVRRTAAVAVSKFVGDTSIPTFANFSLADLGLGRVVLEFSESVLESSFVPSSVTLHSFNREPESTLTLSGGDILFGSGSKITIKLNSADNEAVKKDRHLCETRGSCFVTLKQGAFVDMVGNKLVEAATPKMAEKVISDAVKPQLISFDMNLNDSSITLTFQEPIDTSSIDFSGISVLDSADGKEAVSLSSSKTETSDATVVVIKLSKQDANSIRAASLATSSADTYISLTENTFKDLAPITNSNDALKALPVTNYVADSRPPVLDRFTLDLDADKLTLYFDKPVKTSTLDLSKVLLTNGRGLNVSLIGGSVTPSVGGATDVIINLAPESLVDIKVSKLLATKVDDSFLVISSGALVDMTGNTFLAISNIAAKDFVPDTTRVQLFNYSLDFETGEMTLTFSDVVLAETLQPSAFVIQSAATAVPGVTYTLTSASTTTSPNGYVIKIDLNTDVQGIKSVANLAVTEESTYLRLLGHAIDDPFGVDNVPITDSKALKVGSFVPDNTSPELNEFVLDLREGILNLTFSDTIDFPSIDVRQITIQNAVTGTVKHRLSGDSSVTTHKDGVLLRVELSLEDLNAIKAAKTLATSKADSFVTFPSTALRDINLNAVLPVRDGSARQADLYISDDVRPVLSSFDLNMNTGVMTLHFSETIFWNTVVMSSFTLQSLQNSSSPHKSYQLKSGIVAKVDSADVVVELVNSDFNALKLDVALASSQTNTYLSVVQEAALDANDNGLVGIPSTDALLVDVFVADRTPPKLSRFTFDLDSGKLNLTFTEAVDASSVQLSHFSFVSSSSLTPATKIFSLLGGTVIDVDGVEIAATLSEDDLNGLKAVTGLASVNATTFAGITTDFVVDMNGINVTPITLDSPLQVALFVPDTTAPSLVRFTFDLDAGEIQLTFDETVDASSLNTSRTSVINSSSSASGYVLRKTLHPDVDSHILVLEISSEDLDGIKVNKELATSLNTTLLNCRQSSSRHERKFLDAFDFSNPISSLY
eukprot:m.284220 g.284220  ORF g.284220 m.284220 type:complete len:7575 (+) comp40677_c0_seq9:1023-23747(+)